MIFAPVRSPDRLSLRKNKTLPVPCGPPFGGESNPRPRRRVKKKRTQLDQAGEVVNANNLLRSHRIHKRPLTTEMDRRILSKWVNLGKKTAISITLGHLPKTAKNAFFDCEPQNGRWPALDEGRSLKGNLGQKSLIPFGPSATKGGRTSDRQPPSPPSTQKVRLFERGGSYCLAVSLRKSAQGNYLQTR